ncbi:MAG: trypsin-like peptidase domain-containing protein [Candidatus Hodarchaeales archaeon]|jgi:hypothetical protein
MKLSGLQERDFNQALRNAYDYNRLKLMLRYRLEKSLDDYAVGGGYDVIVGALLAAARMQSWTAKLLFAAIESNPGNSDLLAFAQKLGAVGGTPSRDALESLIKDWKSFLNVNQWYERLGSILHQICRIEIKGRPNGTGFLIGPNLVMTNYHVLETLLDTKKKIHKPQDVILRFDYRQLSDGITVNAGKTYELLKTDWCVAESPTSPADFEKEPKSKLPELNELDFVLVKLDGEPGNAPIGEKPDPDAPARGWMNVPEEEYDFPEKSILFIFQHPEGKPLVLDMDTIDKVNENKTRVTYTTNTEGGSSGSPCLDRNWDLVAIHHSHEPMVMKPTYNEGIPITTIMEFLKEQKLDKLITPYKQA